MIEAFLKLTSLEAALTDLAIVQFDWPDAVEGRRQPCAFYAFDGDLNRWVLARPGVADLRIDLDVQRVSTVITRETYDDNGDVVVPGVVEDRGLHGNMLFTGRGAIAARSRFLSNYQRFAKLEDDVSAAIRTKFNLKRIADNPQGGDLLVKELRRATGGTEVFEPTSGDDVVLNSRKFSWDV